MGPRASQDLRPPSPIMAPDIIIIIIIIIIITIIMSIQHAFIYIPISNT